MFATFGEVKASRAIEIAGVSPTSSSFKSLLNQATQQLLNRGDFAGTIAAIYICAKNGCLVWPRYVGQVRKLNRCHQPIPIRSTWYDFFEQNDYTSWQTCGWLERDCQSSMIAYGKTPSVHRYSRRWSLSASLSHFECRSGQESDRFRSG